MQFHEVQKCTGLSKKALNYYEMKNLIHIEKNESGYREYSQADVELLMKIKVLRKLDFSILEIQQILKDGDNQVIYDEHFLALDKKISQCEIQKSYMYQMRYNLQKDDFLQKLYEIDENIDIDFQQQNSVDMRMDKKSTSIPILTMVEICIGFYLMGIGKGIFMLLGIWSFLHGIYVIRKSFNFLETPFDLMIYIAIKYIKEHLPMFIKRKFKGGNVV